MQRKGGLRNFEELGKEEAGGGDKEIRVAGDGKGDDGGGSEDGCGRW